MITYAVIVEPSEDGTFDVIHISPDHRGFVICTTRNRSFANYLCVVLAWERRVPARPARCAPSTQTEVP